MKIFQCGIYGKGYKPADMSITFYYGMNLDSSFNYMNKVKLFDEEDLNLIENVTISNIVGDEVEFKTVKGFKILGKFGIEKNIVAIPYRIYEIESCEYVHPFYAKDRK